MSAALPRSARRAAPVALIAALGAVAPGVFVAEAQYVGRCSEPSRPYVPSGSFADAGELDRAREDVETYLYDVDRYQECLIALVEAAGRDVNQVVAEWNAAVDVFNRR